MSVVASIFLYVLAALASPYRPNVAKRAPYECGFPAVESARHPFNIRFYLVAILFIVFDIETALLFPWAACFRQLGWYGIICMLLFLALLAVAFVYEWRAGALDWE
jgi:NADH-quinone oxidoreductase subunit A